MIELIGGIEVDGALRRDVALRSLTGAAELMLAELGPAELSQPEKVTRFLSETVASVGGQPVDATTLSVGDRQHLVRQIGVCLGVDLVWLSGECTACGETFEIPVRQAVMPTKQAGDGFPAFDCKIEGTAVQVRTPTGADQAAIAGLDDQAAGSALLDLLVTVPSDVDLSEDQRAQLEQTIEDLSPEVALEVSTSCPECEEDLKVYVDPYLTLTEAGQSILDEIHVLASRYHWAEDDILALPRARRRAYLALIDRDRGMSQHPDPDIAY